MLARFRVPQIPVLREKPSALSGDASQGVNGRVIELSERAQLNHVKPVDQTYVEQSVAEAALTLSVLAEVNIVSVFRPIGKTRAGRANSSHF